MSFWLTRAKRSGNAQASSPVGCRRLCAAVIVVFVAARKPRHTARGAISQPLLLGQEMDQCPKQHHVDHHDGHHVLPVSLDLLPKAVLRAVYFAGLRVRPVIFRIFITRPPCDTAAPGRPFLAAAWLASGSAGAVGPRVHLAQGERLLLIRHGRGRSS